MKKLLLALITIMAAASVKAAVPVDPNRYEPVNGINIKNLWMYDREHSLNAYEKLPLATGLNATGKTRSAVLLNGKVYVAHSEAIVIKEADEGKDNAQIQSVLHVFDALTGELLPDVPLTLDGEPFIGQLAANCIGKDNFGHLWITSYTSENTSTVPFYMVDPETGALTRLATLDKGDVVTRNDYCDVVGDITLEQAECTIIGPGCVSGGGSPTVYGWHNDQGGDADTWTGYFNDYVDPYMDFVEFSPATNTTFGIAPMAKIVLGEDEEDRYKGYNFYIDGFATRPALYLYDGSIVESFNDVNYTKADSLLLFPYLDDNGVNEFALGDRHFVTYVKGAYGTGQTVQIIVAELGDGGSFQGMKHYWTLPSDGMGATSDGGGRSHPISIEECEIGGKPAVRLLTYKGNNGIAVYEIGEGVEPGDTPPAVQPGDVDGNDIINGSDVTALYNVLLNGTDVGGDADVDGNGVVNGSDVTALYNMLLK